MVTKLNKDFRMDQPKQYQNDKNPTQKIKPFISCETKPKEICINLSSIITDIISDLENY